jgi:hypothetical protein
MFSEHFREELLGQLVRATARGAKNILINSSELHCSLGDFPGAKHQRLKSRNVPYVVKAPFCSSTENILGVC